VGSQAQEVQGKPLGGAKQVPGSSDQAQAKTIKNITTSHPEKPAKDHGINRTCISMNKTLQASRFLHTQVKQQPVNTHHQVLLPSITLRRFWGGFSPQTYREVLCTIFTGRII
jgi:hypothetical protein